MTAVRRRALLIPLAVVAGALWWWSALRLVLGTHGTGLLEGGVVAGGWGLSLLPVHCVPESVARAGERTGDADRLRETTPGVAWRDRMRLRLRRFGVVAQDGAGYVAGGGAAEGAGPAARRRTAGCRGAGTVRGVRTACRTLAAQWARAVRRTRAWRVRRRTGNGPGGRD